jgi:hypothetical protein
VWLPRFCCAACGESESGINWPSRCRSTPELDRPQAHLFTLMPYRPAADVLEQMFPVDAARHPETLRRHALKVGEAFGKRAATTPETAAAAIAVTLDSTFIDSSQRCLFSPPTRRSSGSTAAEALDWVAVARG